MNEMFLKNELETINFGKEISKKLKGSEILLLEGPLGSGKTTFVKGIGLGLGIDEKIIRSPSFLIMHNYGKLLHIDFYRIRNNPIEDFEAIGIFEALNLGCIKAIEWPPEFLKKIYCKAWKFYFSYKKKGRYVFWEN